MGETTNNTANDDVSLYHKYFAIFWGFVAIWSVLAFVAIIGNGLVIYASYRHRNLGPLRYFDGVVKSLAFADLLYGLLGMPVTVIRSYISEFEM